MNIGRYRPIVGSSRAEPSRAVVVGGGAAGLAAAWTLKKRGIEPILLEANDWTGGRLAGDRVDGFLVDTGADFFCSSYDVTFRICEELGVPLVRSKMKLGWYRNGRWATTTPGLSVANLIRNLPGARSLGLLSPRSIRPAHKLFRTSSARARSSASPAMPGSRSWMTTRPSATTWTGSARPNP